MDLLALLERTVPLLGYELVDVEISPKGRLVRIFIDKPKGVNVDDCARLSNHLTHLLAVENVDFDRLEVSSPGLDRPLKKEADFARFEGADANIRLRQALETEGHNGAKQNTKNLKGILRGVREGQVLLETLSGVKTIALDRIDRARLIPKIDWHKAKKE